ncbi:hypothetical protein L9F63_014976 [Diploptera punctata]|uniref:Uncharacterized protein n=1 Tax=Diploptera punctata TaxID=6984 RepID=A0AAD8A7J7_DIPPU|nr:hypothetical protein L9F63_014976 [Diploptera punctata]
MSDIKQDNKWKRPKSVPIPTVWRKCSGTKKMEDGTFSKFVIQDITEDTYEEIIEFMVENFCRDETICQSLNISEDPVSKQEFRDLSKVMLSHNLGLVAYVEDENGQPTSKIAGCNVTCISHKSDHLTHQMVSAKHILEIL